MSAISILTSFGLGAAHALEPGHGKTFLVSYLGANSISRKELIKLCFSMAVTHMLLTTVLALVVPFVFPSITENVHQFIMVTASLFIVFIGVKMLYNTVVTHKKTNDCSCGHHHHHEHDHIHPKHEKSKNSVLVGVLQGLLPCPTSLAIIGIAFTGQSGLIASSILGAYAIGFVSFISLLAFMLFFLKGKINLNALSDKKNKWVQVVSATVILLSGFYYMYLGLNHICI